MKIIEVIENTPIKLEPFYIEELQRMKVQNSSLPFRVEKETLIFGNYIVGEIQIRDLKISISPRNHAITLSEVFEMAAFAVEGAEVTDSLLQSYGKSNSIGVSALSEKFSAVVLLLVNQGLTGDIIRQPDRGRSIRGKIIIEKFHAPLAIHNGVDFIGQEYTLNTKSNQIIKSSIIKLLSVEKDKTLRSLLVSLLRDFDAVEEFSGHTELIQSIISSSFSSNQYYRLVLQYAEIVLKDLKLGFKDGELEWYAFLEDSNALFEKYVLKIIKFSIQQRTEKWGVPRNFASIKFGDLIGTKSYIPDILIGYDEQKGNCKLIIDAKNKDFNPRPNSLGNLVDSADIYQILFYCKRLNSKVGALIYPASEDYAVIPVTVENEENIKIFLISVNMKSKFIDRSVKIKKEIEYLLSFS